MQRDMDTLTPLDARNSLLLDRKLTALSDTSDSLSVTKVGAVQDELKPLAANSRHDSDPERYAGATSTTPEPPQLLSAGGGAGYRPLTPSTPRATDRLVANAAPIGQAGMGGWRQPTLPNLGVSASGPYPSYGPAQPRFASGGGYGRQGGGGGYSQGGGYGAGRAYGGYGAAYAPPPRDGY